MFCPFWKDNARAPLVTIWRRSQELGFFSASTLASVTLDIHALQSLQRSPPPHLTLANLIRPSRDREAAKTRAALDHVSRDDETDIPGTGRRIRAGGVSTIDILVVRAVQARNTSIPSIDFALFSSAPSFLRISDPGSHSSHAPRTNTCRAKRRCRGSISVQTTSCRPQQQ